MPSIIARNRGHRSFGGPRQDPGEMAVADVLAVPVRLGPLGSLEDRFFSGSIRTT